MTFPVGAFITTAPATFNEEVIASVVARLPDVNDSDAAAAGTSTVTVLAALAITTISAAPGVLAGVPPPPAQPDHVVGALQFPPAATEVQVTAYASGNHSMTMASAAINLM
jgi:hypothetical protein